MKFMKRVFLLTALVLILGMSGCNNFSDPKITKEDVKTIVLKEHNNHIGKVEIISVSHKGKEYIVKWENKENCENGTDYVNDQNGEITKGEATIC